MERNELVYRIAARIAAIAGVFALVVCALLLYDYSRRTLKDPLEDDALKQLKAALEKQPENGELKAAIADRDLQVRTEYSRQRQFTVIGAVLLVGGVGVFLGAARIMTTARRRLPEPDTATSLRDIESRWTAWARWAVAGVFAVLVGVALLLALSTRTHAPQAAEEPPPSDEEVAKMWPQFRGPGGSATSAYANISTSWDAASGKGIRWKTAVPLPGNNSPVVWKNRVFLTGADKERREVYCFDADSGKLLWQKPVPSTPESSNPFKVNDDTGYAAPTTATDGRRVYAIFANGDLAAFDYGGNLVWSRSLGIPKNSYGHAASLATWKNFLLVPFDQGNVAGTKSRLLSLNSATGETVWEAKREVPNSWSSPIVVRAADRDQVITTADPWVIAYAPGDGKELWRAQCLAHDIGPSPAFADGRIYVASEQSDLAAIRADGAGDVTKTHVLWKGADGLPDTCSPLATKEFVFLLTSDGMLSCYDAAKGDMLWAEDFEGQCRSSPTLAANRVYVVTKSGKVYIVEPTRDKCRRLGEADLGEECVTTPAFQDGRIYLRGKQHLFCIGAPQHLMSDLDLSFVDQIVARLGRRHDAVIPILQAIQKQYRYLPQEALARVCALTEIMPAAITGVATFYSQFRQRPVGRHVIHVCHGTACHVKGAALVQDALERHLGLTNGEDTDAERLFTVEKVACLGCCTLAPVVQIDGATYGRVAPTGVGHMLEDFLRQEKERPAQRTAARIAPNGDLGEIRVGLGSCCVAQGSGKVHAAIEQLLADTGAAAVVKRVGCVGMCHQTPLVELIPAHGPAQLFSKVTADEVSAIVLKQFRPRGLVRRIGYTLGRWLDRLATDEIGDPAARHAIDVRDPPVCAFLGPQKHVATEYCGQIDPTDLDEYLRHNGFRALERCLTGFAPEQIIEHAQASGLRGRGGAGYPTGLKWQTVRAAPGDKKYVVCNGDEGDPGAFMDRMLLESFPYRVIEGMAIAALAVGADEGFFYIRAEYPLAVERVSEALRRCAERGLLGERVLGSDFRLQLSVKEGAGAFVCGEETALLASMEGRRGMPRLRPPFPAECGLWGKPTAVNNVETYSLVPWIFRHGPDAFAALGTERSAGTKVFALAGKVRRGGLIEVPMGVTIRQIVDEIGGGVAGGRSFKAVQVGGPSGGCVPAQLADTPVDYEALAEIGAIMGSGGMVVLDDGDCMVDIARFFLRFTQDQSCGKCTFCRIGTRRMLDMLDRICTGAGKAGDLEELESLGRAVSAGSICGLGRTAPNPVLSTLKYFRDEYEAHLAGRCPAGKCKALIAYQVTNDCIGCTLCAQHCPADAIALTPYVKHHIDDSKCIRCDTCRAICPQKAVIVV